MNGQDKQVVSKLKQIAIISLVFMSVQIIGGILANSISILADAFHLLSDVLAYMISLFAVLMSYKISPKKLTFGYQKLQPLGALFNVGIIWIVTIQLFMEASTRMYNKSLVQEPKYMLATSIFGLCCNLYIMKILHGDQHGGHNCGHDHGTHDHIHQDKQHQHHNHHSSGCKIEKKSSSLELRESNNNIHEHSHEHNNGKSHKCKNHDGHNHEEHNHNGHSHTPKKKCNHNHDHKGQQHHQQHNHDHHDHHDHHNEHKHSQVIGKSFGQHEVLIEQIVDTECKIQCQNDQNDICVYDQQHNEHNHLCLHTKNRRKSQDTSSLVKLDGSEDQIHNHNHNGIQKNINIQAAYIHIITDIILSIGVIISAGIIFVFAPEGHVWSYWQLADPLCTYLFSFMAIYTTIPITKEAINLLLNGCDNPKLLEQIEKQLSEESCIHKVDSLKIWSGKRGKYYGALRAIVKKGNYKSLKKIFISRNIQGFVQLINLQQDTE